MSGFNFADRYRAAGLNPAPGIIGSREKPFLKLKDDLDVGKLVDLTRLYYEVPSAEPSWFRVGFSDGDDSFSLVDNAREAAVLASCLLSSAIAAGDPDAGLAILTTSAAGNRKPKIPIDLIKEAKEGLASQAVTTRKRLDRDENRLSIPKNGITTAVDQIAGSQEWVKYGDVLKTLTKTDITLATQVERAISSLTAEVALLREEGDMLWWYVGGWSKCLELPLTDLKSPVLPVVAGIDLASMVLTETGPVSFSAILHKAIHGSVKKAPPKVTIQEAVDGLPEDAFPKLHLAEKLSSVPDICPLLTAFAKACEIGKSPNWHVAYAKASGLTASTSFSFLDIAVQAYREFLFTTRLG